MGHDTDLQARIKKRAGAIIDKSALVILLHRVGPSNPGSGGIGSIQAMTTS